jgi:hypothetical protein
MKVFCTALLTFSFSALASNPLEEIFRKYESSLMDYKAGMHSVSEIEDSELKVKEDGSTERQVLLEGSLLRVILKVDGPKTYEYEILSNSAKDKKIPRVTLNDNTPDFTSVDVGLNNIQVVNDLLSFDMSSTEEDPRYTSRFNGSFTKNLNSSSFCDYSVFSKAEITYLPTGKVVRSESKEVNKCLGIMPISELKEIDLTEVEFCDSTKLDWECETRDMSFLTSDL